MKLYGKKAQFPEMSELAFSLFLYFGLLIVLLYFSGTAEFNVLAHIEADNAALACQNNLLNFFDSGTKEELVSAVDDNNYIVLINKAEPVFDKLTGTGKKANTGKDKDTPRSWEINIIGDKTFTLGGIDQEDSKKAVACSIFIPKLCQEYTGCLLEVEMERAYAKK